ncbi:MAG TPA: response regulator transcription factor [Burkholderiales bacterium]|nr:response regulator transcription factor [Burkholderiales bacterium]
MIRVLLADDHAIVRTGLREILESTSDIEVAAEAGNGTEALNAVRARDFDVAVLDLSMPGRSGIELIKLVKDERPKLRVLVLTMHSEEQYAVRALRAGASGYLTKESAADELVAAVRRIASGGAYVSPETAQRLVLDTSAPGAQLPHARLSNREFEVFRMIVAGKSVTDIGAALNLSVKTISTHKARILEKMGFASQAELVRYAVEHRLLD